MLKSFKTISVNETENEYREDGAMHYSTLAKYDRNGFPAIETLFEKQESPSLLFGSAVDTLLTEGKSVFDERFYVCKDLELQAAYKNIADYLFQKYKGTYDTLYSIPATDIIAATEINSFYLNWKPETRAKLIVEKASSYYTELVESEGKQIIEQSVYEDAVNCVNALKTSKATEDFFNEPNPFEDEDKELLFQLKFFGVLDKKKYLQLDSENAEDVVKLITTFSSDSGQVNTSNTIGENGDDDKIAFSCMADLIVCDHKRKKVYPCDLKTSSHMEYEFYKSFVQWSYQIQARIYWRLIRAAMDADPVFKDYQLCDYTFIVVNRKSQTPLTWKFIDTQKHGDLEYGDFILKEPFATAIELDDYLKQQSEGTLKFPKGISDETPNDLKYWLTKK